MRHNGKDAVRKSERDLYLYGFWYRPVFMHLTAGNQVLLKHVYGTSATSKCVPCYKIAPCAGT
jgi:hypothetical protein